MRFRPRITTRRLMLAVAVVGFNLGLGSFLHQELRHPELDEFARWINMVMYLAFANVLFVPAALHFADARG